MPFSNVDVIEESLLKSSGGFVSCVILKVFSLKPLKLSLKTLNLERNELGIDSQ